MSSEWIPQELLEIQGKISRGERPVTTVRELVSWFGYKRRGPWVVGWIRQALRKLGLSTVPDFDWTYLDGPITFIIHEPPGDNQSQASPTMEKESSHSADAFILTPGQPKESGAPDPTFRIGRLEIAHRRPISVSPDAPVQQAVHLMLKNDYSQLPVMTSDREVKGLFSWKAFGSRCSQGQQCTYVREAMDDSHEVSTDDSLFGAISLIQRYDCVLVRDSTNRIVGILTPYDISATFGQLAEPFLVLGEIENHIRDLIRGRFTKDELALARDPGDPTRLVGDVTDLTFGEYMRLIENPERWGKLGLQIDRVLFIKDLDEIRRIRNDVMHFDPEGIDDRDLKTLRDHVGFLQRLRKLKQEKPSRHE